MIGLSAAQQDRAGGVLLAQACGDALGVPYEFASPPPFGELAEMRGGGLGPYAPGEWSDDTQMAICIARVTASGGNLVGAAMLDSVAESFLQWLLDDPADVGIQTGIVLSQAMRTNAIHPSERLVAAARDYTRSHPLSAGNGALMRTSIVGVSALHDRDGTATAARRIAELTHADPLAGDSCVLWCEAIRVAVLQGRFDLASGLDLLAAPSRPQWQRWIHQAEVEPSSTFRPNGFTVTALQAAWSAITRTPVPKLDPTTGLFPSLHLRDALHAAVRIGDDTDTVAAIAGGLLGARWGASAVPPTWRKLLHGWPSLRARDLERLAILTASGRPDR